jgi:hypothetical protein
VRCAVCLLAQLQPKKKVIRAAPDDDLQGALSTRSTDALLATANITTSASEAGATVVSWLGCIGSQALAAIALAVHTQLSAESLEPVYISAVAPGHIPLSVGACDRVSELAGQGPGVSLLLSLARDGWILRTSVAGKDTFS